MQKKSGVASVLGLSTPSTLVEFYTAMINTSLLNLDSFDNNDPRMLTILVIGTEEKVRGYLWLQQQNGFAAVGDWSRFLPVPNCPDKVMSILNKTVL